MYRFFCALALCFSVIPASAWAYDKISDRDEFVSLIDGKELRLGIFGISLNVRPDGRIAGDAQGWPITGTWSWQDGFFCREMDWGGYPIDYNCQMVEVRGSAVRFTVDRGAGDSATFNLRDP